MSPGPVDLDVGVVELARARIEAQGREPERVFGAEVRPVLVPEHHDIGVSLVLDLYSVTPHSAGPASTTRSPGEPPSHSASSQVANAASVSDTSSS